MAFVASIKVCDPIRIPVDHPYFTERDPAVRAEILRILAGPCPPTGPAPACPSPAEPDPAGADSSAEPALRDARREAAFFKSMHSRSVAHVQALQRQLN